MSVGPIELKLIGQALEKRFGAVAALRGVDLAIESGQALAVLGPNGAGKSTLLRILAGLARPTAGTLHLEAGPPGALRTRRRGEARALVGFSGHSTWLYPELTARENLIFHCRLQGVAEPGRRADLLLEQEGLADVSHRRAGTFSRGMAQRLSIARAIVHDPPLLLLDEPFTGLDRRAGDRLAERLQRLRDEGRAVVLVSHDLLRASQIADRAIVLLAGRIAVCVSGDELQPDRLEAAYLEALEPGGCRGGGKAARA